jgi:hypothetical protein
MAEYVCDRCGEVNPVGTVFCVNCHAFLAWDQVERDERLAGEQAAPSTTGDSGPGSEQNVETRVMPADQGAGHRAGQRERRDIVFAAGRSD